jgi:hypothetical protein
MNCQRQRIVCVDGSVATLDSAIEEQSAVDEWQESEIRIVGASLRYGCRRIGQFLEHIRANSPVKVIFLSERLAYLPFNSLILVGQIAAWLPAIDIEYIVQVLSERLTEVGNAW